LAGRLGENHSILQICNKTKCVKLVSNVADAIKNQMANGGV